MSKETDKAETAKIIDSTLTVVSDDVIMVISNPDPSLAIELDAETRARIERLEHFQRMSTTRLKDFIVD